MIIPARSALAANLAKTGSYNARTKAQVKAKQPALSPAPAVAPAVTSTPETSEISWIEQMWLDTFGRASKTSTSSSTIYPPFDEARTEPFIPFRTGVPAEEMIVPAHTALAANLAKTASYKAYTRAQAKANQLEFAHAELAHTEVAHPDEVVQLKANSWNEFMDMNSPITLNRKHG
jgi:hypothetical protein